MLSIPVESILFTKTTNLTQITHIKYIHIGPRIQLKTYILSIKAILKPLEKYKQVSKLSIFKPLLISKYLSYTGKFISNSFLSHYRSALIII